MTLKNLHLCSLSSSVHLLSCNTCDSLSYFRCIYSLLLFSMPLNSTKLNVPGSSSCHKANSIPKAKPLTASCPAQSYVVIDATLPSHIINDCLLFMLYMPGCKVHCTAFGHDIIIEGIGDAVFTASQFILFYMRNCWHVPSSPHYFLSYATITSTGHQVMITSWTPRILFPNKHCLAELKLPKYVPLTKVDRYFVLKFEVLLQGSIAFQLLSTMSKALAQEVFSLHCSWTWISLLPVFPSLLEQNLLLCILPLLLSPKPRLFFILKLDYHLFPMILFHHSIFWVFLPPSIFTTHLFP